MYIIKEILWGYHVLVLIFLIGVKISIDTRFFQVRRFFSWLKFSVNGDKSEGGISAFQALSTALAGSIGAGNIVGVGLAISVGGAGSIFWMWLTSIFSMMTVFAEVVLATVYKKEGKPGAIAYISRIGKGKVLPFIYGIGLVCSSLAMGNMAQSNAFAVSANNLGIPMWVSGIALAVSLVFISKGGISCAVKFTEKLVPVMTVFFMVFSISLLTINRQNIPLVFNEIMEGAFSVKAGLGGGMYIAVKTGISRAVFTNEAGLGISSIAFANVKKTSAIKLGYLGIFQVFMDTTVMCTITAFCILCATDLRQGDALAFIAFENTYGDLGLIFINICTMLFAFATLTATSYYGKEGLRYLSKNKLTKYYPYFFGFAAFVGCNMTVGAVFEISDALNGLLAIPNLIALSMFLKRVVSITKK